MNRAGFTDKQISMELGMRESNVRWCVACRIGGHK